jgi:hypothetical protein
VIVLFTWLSWPSRQRGKFLDATPSKMFSNHLFSTRNTQRFDEMVDHMKAVAQQPQELTVEERNLLSVAYKVPSNLTLIIVNISYKFILNFRMLLDREGLLGELFHPLSRKERLIKSR